jgi:hypothetical protein
MRAVGSVIDVELGLGYSGCASGLYPAEDTLQPLRPCWVEAEIQPADMTELHRIITETPVQNDIQGWCCQDYVMEALERFE